MGYFYTYYPNNLTLPFGSFFTLTFINNGFSVDNLFYMFQYMFWALSFIFFPSYLMRSFPGGQAVVTEEFVPIETKKNMDFTVPSVSDALSKEKATIVNTLGLDIGSHDSQPNSDQIQDQRSN